VASTPGNPVLLLHGFTTSAQRTWHEPGWVDLLTEAGREVVAPDLLGHGTARKPHKYQSYESLEADLADDIGDGPYDAIGYSAGARILLVLASRYPKKFGRIVVGGVGGGLLKPRLDNPILDALEGRSSQDNMVAMHFKSLAESDGNDIAALTAFIKRVQPPLNVEHLAKVVSPTLVVIGDKDFAYPAEPLADAIPDAELVTLRGVDHFGLPKAFGFLERSLDFVGAAPF